MYSAVDSFALLALPTVVLTGELLSRCRITERLIDVARLLVGWIKGGLAHVNVVSSMFFAGHIRVGIGGHGLRRTDPDPRDDQGALSITDNRFLLVLIIIAFFLVVGTFMDALANSIARH